MKAPTEKNSQKLFEVNNLIFDDGIWTANQSNDLSYSDGLDTELELQQILKNCKDKSWDSPELALAYDNWAVLYHLSPLRSNILRGLNLKSSGPILEVGCGCGAITRYLGDKGFDVDAIEGSRKRSRLTALRCEDLDNVSVICSDFNTLNLPEKKYDLILFIGVLEYAKKFSSSKSSATDIVKNIVRKSVKALSNHGRIIIAIENKIGIKYFSGWPEDHLSKPWVGAANYPENINSPSGVATFNYSEWCKMLEDLGLSKKFFFPLPDYKLPEAIIFDDKGSVTEKLFLYSKYGSVNRTGNSIWKSPLKLQHSAIILDGLEGHFSDSLGIIISKNERELSDISVNDWIIFDTPWKKTKETQCNDLVSHQSESYASSNLSSAVAEGSSRPLLLYWLQVASVCDSADDFIMLVSSHCRKIIEIERFIPAWMICVDGLGEISSYTFPYISNEYQCHFNNQGEWLANIVMSFCEYASLDLMCFPTVEKYTNQIMLFTDISNNLSDIDLSAGKKLLKDVNTSLYDDAIKTNLTMYWARTPFGFTEENKLFCKIDIIGKQDIILECGPQLKRANFLRVDPSDHFIKKSPAQVKLTCLELETDGFERSIDLINKIRRGQVTGHSGLKYDFEGDDLVLYITNNDPWLVFDLRPDLAQTDSNLIRLCMTMVW